MRAQEFVKEDGFTPAQQAAQRAGMGTKAWTKGPPPAPPPPLAKRMGKAALKYAPMVGTAMSAVEAYDRWQAGDRTGAVISALAAAGYLVPGPGGWVLGGSLDMAGELRDAGLVQDPFGPPANQRPVGPETGKHPWDRSQIKEESASDINPNTGKPYTTDEWNRYWNPGAGRPYTEKEKEMFADPDVTVKSVGKEVLRRIPGIGALINIGDAVKGFKDLSR
jgi:hypothetical protein